jgi:hypothetical protein
MEDMMKTTLDNMNKYFGGDMNQEKQREDRFEERATRRESLIADRIEEINDCDVEHVFKKYRADLAGIWQLYHDRDDAAQKLVEELRICIEVEAKGDIDNKLSGE